MANVLNGALPKVDGKVLISQVPPGAETFGSAEDLAAYQMMNNAGIDNQAVANIFSSQPYLQEAISYMAEIFRPGGDKGDKKQFLMTFGSGPQAVVKVANLLKAAHQQWGQLTFLMRAGGEIREEVYESLYQGSGPGKWLPRLQGQGGQAANLHTGGARSLYQRLRQRDSEVADRRAA